MYELVGVATHGGKSGREGTIFNPHRLTQALQLPSRGLLALRTSRIVRQLSWSNLTSKASIVDPTGPVVCLTSYGNRLKTVYLAIESIGQGSILPSRLILWVDQEDVFRQPPFSLKQLCHRGLEIRLARNYGPHTKYYPYVQSEARFTLPMITADDDILYANFWLERLIQANAERPDLINCYRARVIKLESRSLAPYLEWGMCNSTEPSIRHFATGVSGVIYPHAFLEVLRQRGTGFEKCCPKADDIWLHVQALRAGYKVRQIVKRYMHFPMVPGTQHLALQRSNWGERDSGNDGQAAMTYTPQDLEVLCRALSE